MEIAQIILDYIKVIIYPGVVIFAILLFRKEITSLLQGKLKAQYKHLTITIERQQKVMAAIKSNQAIVAQKIESEIGSLSAEGTILDRSQHAENVRKYLRVLAKVNGHWENLIIEHLRSSKESENEHSIISSVTEDSDPWRSHKDEDQAEGALYRLLKQSILSKDEEGKIHLHQAFM